MIVKGLMFVCFVSFVVKSLFLSYMHENDAETIISQTNVCKENVIVTKHNDRFHIGEMSVQVLHTPGHTPGSQVSNEKMNVQS
jgi:hypothetical protein